MTAGARHLPAALAIGLALATGGCGSSSEEEPDAGQGLPQSFVDALEPRLEEVQRRYDDGVENGNPGACEDIALDSFEGPGGIEETLAGLPDDVDPQLRRAVAQSVGQLRSLTEDCVEQAEAAAEEATPIVPEEEYTPPPEEEPEEEPDEESDDEGDDNGDDDGGGGDDGDDDGAGGGGGNQPAPAPTPQPEPAPEQPQAVPPGQDGGVPAPAPRGDRG